MTALTADRNTARMEGDVKSLAVAAAMTIFAGSLVMRNAAGHAVKGAAAIGLRGAGRAEERVDNSAGGAGDWTILVRTGIFRFDNSSSADEITAADIGSVCYAADDQTVARTSGGNARSPAGIVTAVSALGVEVLLDEAVLGAALAASMGTPAFSLSAESSNNRVLSIQLKDALGADLARRAAVFAYFSDDANGDSLAATAFDTVVAGTDGVVIEPISNNMLLLVSEADGDIDVSITEDAVVTKYLILVMPDGRLVSSGAIAFA